MSAIFKNFLTAISVFVILLIVFSFKTSDRTIVVSKDGKGDFKTIQEAVNSVENDTKNKTKITKKSIKHSAKKTFITTKKMIIMCVGWDKKCTKPTKVLGKQKLDTRSIYHTIKPKTVKVAHCEEFVLKQKEIEA